MKPSTDKTTYSGLKILAIIILFTTGNSSAAAQPLENEYPATYIGFSYGYSIPLTTLETGEITDQLIGFRSRFDYARYFSGTKFLNERLGLNYHWQRCYAQERSGQDASFYDLLTQQYNSDYFFIAYETPEKDNNLYNRDFSQGYIGLVYRVANERFFLLPQLSLGYTTFYTTNVTLRLKEKNSNRYHTVEYKNDKYQDSYFTAAYGARAGVRVINRIHFTIECGYTWFRPDFTYTINQNDLVEGTSSSREVSYTRNLHSLSVGFGLTYEFDYNTIDN